MKKPKINLSGESIKQFFLAHGEKLVFGAALVGMGFLVVSAIRKETLPADKSKPALTAISNNIDVLLNDPNPDIKPPVVPKVNVPSGPPNAADLLAVSKWPFLYRPLYKQLVEKRTAVAAKPLTDLRGYGDRGAIGLKAAGGPAAPAVQAAAGPPVRPAPGDFLVGGAPAAPAPVAGGQAAGNMIAQGRHFIIMTGLAPILDQQKEFDHHFAGAIHPGAADDLQSGPKKIDRFHPEYWDFEIQRREVLPTGNGPETTLDIKAIQADKDIAWAHVGEEVAHKDYLDPKLTFPLPPLLVKKWDARASHPKIKLKAEEAHAAPVDLAPPARDIGQVVPPADDDVFGAGNAKKNAAVAAEPDIIRDKLFRFWDYSVQPDHAYQYRVQLKLINPNFRLHDRVLQDPAVAKTPFLTAPWSEWSGTISVPRDQQILAKSVEFDRQLKEPYAKVVCWTWNNKEAVEANHEFSMFRGDEAKFAADVDVPNPAGGGNQPIKGFKFEPNMMLLDFRGGDQNGRPAGPMKPPPCELIFLDETTNRTTIRREVQDAPIVAELTNQNAAAAPPTAGGPPPVGGGVGPGAPPGFPGGLPPAKGPPGLDPGRLLLTPPTGKTDKAVDKTKGAKKTPPEK